MGIDVKEVYAGRELTYSQDREEGVSTSHWEYAQNTHKKRSDDNEPNDGYMYFN